MKSVLKVPLHRKTLDHSEEKKNRRTSTPFKFYKNEKFICKFEGISQAILHEQCSVKSKNS